MQLNFVECCQENCEFLKDNFKMNQGSVNDIIKICVGGQNFKTTRATLLSDKDSLLAKMFESEESGFYPTLKVRSL